ncbi:hypothetical protein HDU83_009077, partial [Entophlyctis luteolus]
YSVHEGPFPISERDTVLASTVRGLGGPDVVYVSTSVELNRNEEQAIKKRFRVPSRVRMDVPFMGWIIRDLGMSGIEIVYIGIVDPMGALSPCERILPAFKFSLNTNICQLSLI